MARMTPAEKAAAKAKKTEQTRKDRAYKRLNDDKFVAAEQAARDKYNAFTIAAKAFTKAHIAIFDQWQKLKGTPVVPSATQPSHTLSPAPTTDQPFEFPVAERPDVYGALSKDGTPTAPSLERRRMAGVDTRIIRQLGL